MHESPLPHTQQLGGSRNTQIPHRLPAGGGLHLTEIPSDQAGFDSSTPAPSLAERTALLHAIHPCLSGQVVKREISGPADRRYRSPRPASRPTGFVRKSAMLFIFPMTRRAKKKIREKLALERRFLSLRSHLLFAVRLGAEKLVQEWCWCSDGWPRSKHSTKKTRERRARSSLFALKPFPCTKTMAKTDPKLKQTHLFHCEGKICTSVRQTD